jgi:RES domain
VLYASPSLTVCIHECRITLADDVFVATLRPKRDLNFIDLSGNYDEPDDADPFDSVEWFLNGLMSSSRPDIHRYCRRIASTLWEATSCDGLAYNSYFRNVAGANLSPRINYAIFGRPIADGKVQVKSINTVRFESIAYDFRLGPIFE